MKNSIVRQKAQLRSLVLVLLFTIFIVSPVTAASETPEETLAWCASLAIDASEMALKAQMACDYPTAQIALNMADEAAYLVEKVSRLAHDTANPQLAWSAYNVCNQVAAAIANVIRAAKHIESHSLNSDDVHAADFLIDVCESAQKSNNVSMELALMPISGIPQGAEAHSK